MFRESNIMIAISLFVECILFLYVLKYSQYSGLVELAAIMQYCFLVLVHYLVKYVIKSFGGDPDEYQTFCWPEIGIINLKGYILSI